MGTIDRIIAIIGAISTLILLWNSKPALLKRIACKERRHWNTEQEMTRQYGVCNQHRPPVLTPLDRKKEKLQQQIERLKSYL